MPAFEFKTPPAINRLLAALIFSFLLGGLGLAHAQPAIPAPWKDYAQTREMEKLLHQFFQSKDTRILSAAYKKIAKEDRELLVHLLNLQLKNRTEKEERERSEFAFHMTPCSYAGLDIRLLIIISYSQGKDLGSEFKTPVIPNLEDRFAEDMNRCERLGRKPRTERLIGTAPQ